MELVNHSKKQAYPVQAFATGALPKSHMSRKNLNKKMKKTIFKITLALVAGVLMTSCVSTNKGFQSSPVISRNVSLDPIKADIKVNETTKLIGESTSTYFLSLRISGDNTYADGINYSTDASASAFTKYNPLSALKLIKLNQVRASAAYKALSTGEYDILIHPTYTMTTTNYFIVKTYQCTVTGYGARYSNFRTEKQKIIITGDKEYEFPEK